MTDELTARLYAVEARQREYGQHDPGCPERLREVAQRGTDMHLAPATCSCWLASPGPSPVADGLRPAPNWQGIELPAERARPVPRGLTEWLREILDQDRQILELHGVAWNAEVCAVCHSTEDAGESLTQEAWPCPTVRVLASAYADRPGYRKEWKL